MDPDANLREQRELIARLHSYIDAHAEYSDMPYDLLESTAANALALCELVEALDGWISRGGFLPQEWRRDNDHM